MGSFLLEAVAERARADGRRLMSGSILADAATGKSAGTAFAERRGFVQRHVELHQVIELPLSDERLAALEARIAGQHEGYRLVQWREHTPDEWLEQFADALSVMTEEIPTGDLDLEPARWTPERILEAEARRLKQGRFCHTTVAVASDGRLAAYTQMGGAAERRIACTSSIHSSGRSTAASGWDGGQDPEPALAAGGAGPPGRPAHLERAGERPDDCRQQPPRVPAGRSPRQLATRPLGELPGRVASS